MESHSSLQEWLTDKLVILTRIYDRCFLELSRFHFKDNNCQCLLPMIKFKLSGENQVLKKFVPSTVGLSASPNSSFSDETCSEIDKFIFFLILYNEMCQYLEDLNNSVSFQMIDA